MNLVFPLDSMLYTVTKKLLRRCIKECEREREREREGTEMREKSILEIRMKVWYIHNINIKVP